MNAIVYAQVCPQCGASLETPPGFTGVCAHCGTRVGHDSAVCNCETCQDYRDAQLGLLLLDHMKRAKAQRQGDGVQGKEQEKPKVASTFSFNSGKVCNNCGQANSARANFCASCGKGFFVKTKSCSSCGCEMTMNAKFCPRCGSRQ